LINALLGEATAVREAEELVDVINQLQAKVVQLEKKQEGGDG
jgi:hypothetical protein